jgi:hypothetical protein
MGTLDVLGNAGYNQVNRGGQEGWANSEADEVSNF